MRRIFLFLLLLMGSFPLFGASLDSLLLGAPRHVIPVGVSEPLDVLSRSPRSICVRLSPRAEVEVVAITHGERLFRVTLTTLLLPAADTEVRFWDADWREVQADMPQLKFDDFYVAPEGSSTYDRDELRRLLYPLHVRWTWDDASSAFVARASMEALPDFESQRWQKHVRERRFSLGEILNWGVSDRKKP